MSHVKGLFAAGAFGGIIIGMTKGYLPQPKLTEGCEAWLWGVKDVPKSELKNAAFVFIKPQSMREEVREFVEARLLESGCRITGKGVISSEEIDKKQYIDQHYYAIASKATILKPSELNIPEGKFQDKFGLSWKDALSKGLAVNAMDACKEFGVDGAGLEKLWAKNKNNCVKFGGGFYCSKIEHEGKTRYVFNGFFMNMRAEFTTPGRSIQYYTVEWSPKKLSWEDFRGKVLGGTDPSKAPPGSLRRDIYDSYEKLGLPEQPNTGNNCVHASASPFEGLAERMNWLQAPVRTDPYGKALLDAGVKLDTIRAWSVDPQVNIGGGKKGSLFDQLEDLDAEPCMKKALELQALQA